jgi:hypothetical protein
MRSVRVISLHEASRRLRQDRRYVKGLIHGLGIETQEVGRAVAVSEDDLDRLREEIDRHKTPAECPA